jgi:hypothetical protein
MQRLPRVIAVGLLVAIWSHWLIGFGGSGTDDFFARWMRRLLPRSSASPRGAGRRRRPSPSEGGRSAGPVRAIELGACAAAQLGKRNAFGELHAIAALGERRSHVPG